VHDAGGELERIENAASGALIESFAYDDAGRRVERAVAGGPTTRYAYDPLGRLSSVDQTGPNPFSLALAYDAAGHRRRRTDASGTARYLGEWLEERAGTRIRLVHAPGVDDVLAEVEDAATPVPRYLLADAAGNVVQVGKLAPSGAGTVEATRRYFAFGEVRSESSPFPPVERGFAGRPSEAASGLLYLRARHYDPRTGAFLQPDPLGIATDHAYAYASSNPFVYGDPWGLLSTANKAMNASLSGAGSITAEATRNLGTVNPSGAGTAAVSMGPGGALGTYTRLASAGNVATDAAFASPDGVAIAGLGQVFFAEGPDERFVWTPQEKQRAVLALTALAGSGAVHALPNYGALTHPLELVRNPTIRGFGETPFKNPTPGGRWQIDVHPDAFQSRAQLRLTLGHEIGHVFANQSGTGASYREERLLRRWELEWGPRFGARGPDLERSHEYFINCLREETCR
jgi:RHS repeat-associated protein